MHGRLKLWLFSFQNIQKAKFKLWTIRFSKTQERSPNETLFEFGPTGETQAAWTWNKVSLGPSLPLLQGQWKHLAQRQFQGHFSGSSPQSPSVRRVFRSPRTWNLPSLPVTVMSRPTICLRRVSSPDLRIPNPLLGSSSPELSWAVRPTLCVQSCGSRLPPVTTEVT